MGPSTPIHELPGSPGCEQSLNCVNSETYTQESSLAIPGQFIHKVDNVFHLLCYLNHQVNIFENWLGGIFVIYFCLTNDPKA